MLPRTLIGAMSPQMSVLQRFGTPALDLNLAGDSTLDPRITATRASTKTYFDSTGTMQTAAVNEFPSEYDPATLQCLGRSFWEARTNSIRNNTMVGAAAGTPGTLPTNWWTYSLLTGLTRQIVGTGTEDGINYIDIRVYGTPSGAGQYLFAPEVNTAAPAVSGQTWTMSEFCKLATGSLSGVSSLYTTIAEYNSGSVFLTSTSTAFTPTSADLATQRYGATRTLTQATCASAGGYLTLVLSGTAVDFTLRIGLPQFELGATATPVIATTSAAATRAADVVSMTGTNFSSWYNQTEGTFLATTMVPYVTAASQFRRVLEANDGTANKEILITYYQAAGVNRSYGYIKDTTEQADLNTSSANGNTSAGTAYTSVVAYKANDFAASHLGTSVLTDTSGTVPTNNQLLIGGTPVANQHINGFISRITYWNRRLANADLPILSRST